MEINQINAYGEATNLKGFPTKERAASSIEASIHKPGTAVIL